MVGETLAELRTGEDETLVVRMVGETVVVLGMVVLRMVGETVVVLGMGEGVRKVVLRVVEETVVVRRGGLETEGGASLRRDGGGLLALETN